MAALGTIFPFFSLYFKTFMGLDGLTLGIILAIGPLFGILASPFWGVFADTTGYRKEILIIVTIGSSIGYMLIQNIDQLIILIFALAFLSIFTSPVMSMATSLTFGILGKINSINFGRIRVWGTIGYLSSVITIPFALTFIESSNHNEISESLRLIFPLAAIFCLIACLPLFKIEDHNDESTIKSKPADLRILMKSKTYKRLLIVSFFTFMLLSSPISLFPLLVIEMGGNIQQIGLLWIPMLILEIPLIFYAGTWMRKLGAKNFILIGIFCDGMRWLLTIMTSELFWIFLFQMLHGVVVVGLFIGMQMYIENELPKNLRSTAQTLLGMIMGLGSVLSFIWSGVILEFFTVATPFLISGFLAVILFAITWKFLPNQEL